MLRLQSLLLLKEPLLLQHPLPFDGGLPVRFHACGEGVPLVVRLALITLGADHPRQHVVTQLDALRAVALLDPHQTRADQP